MKLKKIYILLSLSLAGMTTFSACQDFLSESHILLWARKRWATMMLQSANG